jgi:ABC-type microcin C transport system duplicated ATPase subunit YejF
VQAQILALLASLQRRYGIAVIFISHDLSVVASIADQILVMQEGVVVERGSVEDIFQRPQQAYTRQLLEAIPRGAKAQAAKVTEQAAPLLQVEDLKTHFRPVSSGLLGLLRPPADPVKAVDGVSFTIERGDIVGLVGESGSGKSTLGRSLLRLLPVTAGAVHFDGLPLGALAPAALRAQRRHMQMIFQDPYASLNPRMTVAQTLAEPLIYHRLATSQQVHQQVFALMDEVGLVRGSSGKYPHEFSGGQRQRIAIARAIASKPAFIVADEPVSALDASIQAQILALLLELVASHGLTMLFISHDLSVVRQLCDRVMVMHRGKIVEQGLTEQLYSAPQDRYTQALLAAASAPP